MNDTVLNGVEWNMKKYIIIHNRIKCLKCGDVIESEYRHDYKTCRCGACAVDGGHDYLRRGGKIGDWEEMNEIQESKTDQ